VKLPGTYGVVQIIFYKVAGDNFGEEALRQGGNREKLVIQYSCQLTGRSKYEDIIIVNEIWSFF
jgi:hypothetical protein